VPGHLFAVIPRDGPKQLAAQRGDRAWHRRIDHVGSVTLAHKGGGEISPLGDHERMLANTHRPGRRR
jgi:hypothetical protein